MTTDAPRSDSPPDVTLMDQVSPYPPGFAPLHHALYAWVIGQLIPGRTSDEILGKVPSEHRPAVARYLVQQGEVLRSEFRSEAEAEAFWAHVGEDARCDFCGCMHEPDAPGFEGCAAELEAMYQPERHR